MLFLRKIFNSIDPRLNISFSGNTVSIVLGGILAIGGCGGNLPVVRDTGAVVLPEKLLTISDIEYQGAFALPVETFGQSSVNWSEGVIEVSGDSLYIVGHAHHDAIAEFAIPELRQSTAIGDLVYANNPRQVFTSVLDKARNGNREELDQIAGLELFQDQLFGNALQYYDAPADNTLTTFVVADGNNLAESPVNGFFSLGGRARAAGWLSQVPDVWQKRLGCTHISGHSSGGPIISRHSVGPSAFCVNLADMLMEQPKHSVRTAEMLGFGLGFQLHNDLFNESGKNNLWTHLSQARFGFIVPGTSTYLTIGTSGGHVSGVGYKLTRNGETCDGYCSFNPEDNYNYYWLWNMEDLVAVRDGKASANRLKPYESGVFNIPFQSDSVAARIGGGSYDEDAGLLYLSLVNVNNTLGGDFNPPVVVAYSFN